MAKEFARDEVRKREEILEKLDVFDLMHALPKNSIRSIEELARIQRLVPGLGFGYLSTSQQRWLMQGGYDLIKATKPRLAKLVEELMEKPGIFPVRLVEVAELVQERIREKAKRGELPEKYKRAVVVPVEVDTILRFKKDPFYSRGEKTEAVAEALVEVLEDLYRKEKEKMKGEDEPDIKVALEVAKLWLSWFRKAKSSPFSVMQERTK